MPFLSNNALMRIWLEEKDAVATNVSCRHGMLFSYSLPVGNIYPLGKASRKAYLFLASDHFIAVKCTKHVNIAKNNLPKKARYFTLGCIEPERVDFIALNRAHYQRTLAHREHRVKVSIAAMRDHHTKLLEDLKDEMRDYAALFDRDFFAK